MSRDNSPNKRLESDISIIATPALILDSWTMFNATVLTSRKVGIVELSYRETGMAGTLGVGGKGVIRWRMARSWPRAGLYIFEVAASCAPTIEVRTKYLPLVRIDRVEVQRHAARKEGRKTGAIGSCFNVGSCLCWFIRVVCSVVRPVARFVRSTTSMLVYIVGII